MAKVKVFRFEVSNWSSGAFDDDKKNSYYSSAQRAIATEEQIEEIINDFAKNNIIISINTDAIQVQNHNNGRGNTVHLIYSILYN